MKLTPNPGSNCTRSAVQTLFIEKNTASRTRRHTTPLSWPVGCSQSGPPATLLVVGVSWGGSGGGGGRLWQSDQTNAMLVAGAVVFH